MDSCCRTQELCIETVTLANCDESIREFSKEFFFPNMCHVCRRFGDGVNLKRCGACDMISYCNEHHQKKDWPSHKQFCKVISQLKQKWKVNNVFHDLKSTAAKNLLHVVGNKKDDYNYLHSLKNVSYELMRDVVHLLQRKLTKIEFQMIMYPRVCAVCYESNPKLLKNCKKCPLACFCNEHLNDPDHEAECLKIQACFNTVTSVQFRLNALGDKFMVDAAQYHPADGKLPSSMAEFCEMRMSTDLTFEHENKDIPSKVIRSTILKRFISDRFSRPLTTVFAIEKLALNNLQSMVIHVVGSKFDEVLACDWEVILHFLPKLRVLKLIFIGPEVLNPPQLRRFCSTCKEQGKRLLVKTESVLYHVYCRDDSFTKPDMIVCFNPAFSLLKTWEESIKVFDKGQCPLVVTALYRADGFREKKCIDSVFPSSKCIYFDDNPFTYDCYQRQDVYFPIAANNYFLFIYENLDKKKVYQSNLMCTFSG